MKAVFGASIGRVFYALAGDEPFRLYSQAASCYLFSTLPTLAEAQAGTGAIASATTWTQSDQHPYPNYYSYAAVSDPEQGITEDFSKTYYEAVNFRLQSGQQVQTLVRAFDIYRIREQEDNPDASVALIKEVFPAISSYLTDAEITTYIKLALDEMKIDLTAQGWSWSKLIDLDQTRLAIAYRAIALGSLAQIRQQNDRHELRYNEFNKKYKETLVQVKVREKAANESTTKTEAPAKRGFSFIMK